MTGRRRLWASSAARLFPQWSGARLARRVQVTASRAAIGHRDILIRHAQALLGMPITLIPLDEHVPVELTTQSAYGLVVDGLVVIFYRTDGSPLHQLHLVGHEIYHLLAGHPTNEELTHRAHAHVLDTLSARFPDVRPELISHLVGRCVSDPNTRPSPSGPANTNSGRHAHETKADRFAYAFVEGLGLTEDRTAMPDTPAGRLMRLLTEGDSP